MAAKPIYVWDGSSWVEFTVPAGTNGQGLPTGGTDGQFLAKKTNTNFDTEWKTPTGSTSEAGFIQLIDSISSTSTSLAVTSNSIKTVFDGLLLETLTDAKGDLIVGTAADTASKLTVGTDGTILVADSSATEGVKWFQQPMVHSSGKYYTSSVTAGTGFVTGVGAMNLTPFFVTKTTTYTKIAVRLLGGNSSGRTARLGIYTSLNGLPDTLIVDAGTVDCSTTGTKSITISQSLTPAVYFLAAVPQGSSGGTNFRSFGGGNTGPYVSHGTVAAGIQNNQVAGYLVSSVTGALPSTISSPGFSANAIGVYLGV